ncbi:hypothetical protein BCR35DRAFT_34870 [Leucosporidium creatinivorum]|uniref:UBA domain-containing protein n=1 Tax=Leucosporidium creatinivorum TaxID=106004 RepID=A0A1Y2CDB8_9BASI|nr:hypothetical protein BCR35DRAFT_34870 [Leucosporidium creatinivorum]
MASAQLQSLLALGIPKQKAIYALREHDNEVEVAADWCFLEGAEWTPQDLLSTSYKPSTGERAPPDSPPSSFAQLPLSSSSTPTSTTAAHPSASLYSINRPPPRRLLLPGTRVKIILKADQPTGRTVEGAVGEVLTRGDHPRGVKVRLQDGRVGRVVGLL